MTACVYAKSARPPVWDVDLPREGTLGECAMCGEEIGEKRMNAIPWARYCVNCQELAEKEELAERWNERDIGSEEE